MMADELALKKRALELELELAQAQQAQGQMTHQPGLQDPDAVGQYRKVVAPIATGASAAVAGLADLATSGLVHKAEDTLNAIRRPINVVGQLLGKDVASGDVKLSEPLQYGPMVQNLEDVIAGEPRKPGEYMRPALSAATGSLLFPGGPAINAASGGAASLTDTALANVGVGPKTRLLADTLAALAVAKGGQAANRFLANRFDMPLGGTARVVHALDRSDPAALKEAAKVQAEMASRGLSVLPSQATAGKTPGLTQLEGEVLLSKGKAGQGVRNLVFAQEQQMDDLARQLVGKMPGAVAPEGRAASDLVQAAKKRLAAEGVARQSVTELDYEAGKQAIRHIPKETLQGVREELKAAQKAAPAASLEASHLANLQRRYEAVVRASGGRPRPVDLWQLHRDFVDSLDAPNTFTANTVKESLRKTSERLLMKTAEEAAPSFERARTVAGALKDRNPVRLDPLAKLGGASDATSAMRQILQDPDPIAQIASGVPAWKNDLAQMRRVGTEVLGADMPAAQTGLKTAMELARQRAFQLDARGMRPASPGARFASEVAGLPAQRQALANALKAVGADAPGTLTTLDDITALSRPTAVSGTHDIGTGIAGMDVLKAGSPHGLQAAQGRMNIIRNSVNALSNRTVAKLLERPDSLVEMQRIAGAQALEPRALLSLILARQAQNQPVPQE